MSGAPLLSASRQPDSAVLHSASAGVAVSWSRRADRAPGEAIMDDDAATCLLTIEPQADEPLAATDGETMMGWLLLAAAAACIGTGVLLAVTDQPPGVAQAMLLAGLVLDVGY